MKLNRLKLLFIGLAGAILLMACSAKDLIENTDNYSGTIQSIGVRNKEVLTLMYEAGLLSTTDYLNYSTSIDKVVSAYTLNESTANDDDIFKQLKSATAWRTSHSGGNCICKETEANGEYTYPKLEKIHKHVENNLKPRDNPTPIKVISDTMAKDMEKFSDIDVYMLDKTTDSGNDIYEIYTALNKLQDEIEKGTSMNDNIAREQRQILDKYFVKVDGATLLPKVDTVTNTSGTTKNGTGYSYTNDLGKDLLVHANGVAIIGVRVTEFSTAFREQMKNLRTSVGNGSQAYLVDMDIKKSGASKRAYYLNYPLNNIDSIGRVVVESEEEDTVEYRDTWKAELYIDSMKFNLLTGELKNGSNIIKLEDSLYTIDENGSSIGIAKKGYRTDGFVRESYEVGGNGKKSKNNVDLYIKDYLELIYMPDVVEDESLVALGRKIRIDLLEGNEVDVIGRYIRQDGKISTGGNIRIGMLASSTSLGRNTDNTYVKLSLNRENETVEIPYIDTGMASDNQGEKVKYVKYVNKIRLGTILGSNKVAKEDISHTGIKYNGIILDSNDSVQDSTGILYNNWINVGKSDSESGNLLWWNDWLANNNYNYRIKLDNIKGYFAKKYTFDIAKDSDQIILDITAISKIQKEIDHKKLVERATDFRTYVVGLGFILLGYSVLFLLFWFIDVNIVNSKLLSIITFGRCVAVTSYSEAPSINERSIQFVTLGGAIKKTVIITAIAILCFLVDPVTFTETLADKLGNISKIIERVIRNK